jgi:arylsulfatase A-like enzyme
VREGDWKLIWRTLLPSSVELYNIKQDPAEKDNLAASNPEKVAELQKRIEALSKEGVKPLFLVDQMKVVTKNMQGEPVMPGEDAFYEGDEP